jgi:predicted small secreted protein
MAILSMFVVLSDRTPIPMMKNFRFALITLSLGASLILSGCNTVRGIGQDVQRAGSAVENAAKK